MIIKPEEISVLPINKIINGDVLETLKRLPSDSIDCIVTSPPYWGLRDYGVKGQIGLEHTLEEYLENLLNVTKELKRVLKATGVLFWNHGDSFHNKCKTLQGLRLALRMIDEQGWILRNDIIWYKPNHMPESVKDRFAKSYEHVFMFVKSEKYWFDLDAVREPHKLSYKEAWRPSTSANKRVGVYSISSRTCLHERRHLLGKNPGDVWLIKTEPFPNAHFAVFPTKLVERCVLAGCPEQICKRCGEPRRRVVESIGKERVSCGVDRKARILGEPGKPAMRNIWVTVGWSDCGCNVGWKPGIVLDPFLGSGTTALVALRLGRNFIGIDLNEEYCKMAFNRIKNYLNQPKLTGWFD